MMPEKLPLSQNVPFRTIKELLLSQPPSYASQKGAFGQISRSVDLYRVQIESRGLVLGGKALPYTWQASPHLDFQGWCQLIYQLVYLQGGSEFYDVAVYQSGQFPTH